MPSGVQSKTYSVYTLGNAKTVNKTRLEYLPLGLMVLAVRALAWACGSPAANRCETMDPKNTNPQNTNPPRRMNTTDWSSGMNFRFTAILFGLVMIIGIALLVKMWVEPEQPPGESLVPRSPG